MHTTETQSTGDGMLAELKKEIVSRSLWFVFFFSYYSWIVEVARTANNVIIYNYICAISLLLLYLSGNLAIVIDILKNPVQKKRHEFATSPDVKKEAMACIYIYVCCLMLFPVSVLGETPSLSSGVIGVLTCIHTWIYWPLIKRFIKA